MSLYIIPRLVSVSATAAEPPPAVVVRIFKALIQRLGLRVFGAVNVQQRQIIQHEGNFKVVRPHYGLIDFESFQMKMLCLFEIARKIIVDPQTIQRVSDPDSVARRGRDLNGAAKKRFCLSILAEVLITHGYIVDQFAGLRGIGSVNPIGQRQCIFIVFHGVGVVALDVIRLGPRPCCAHVLEFAAASHVLRQDQRSQ